jgi:OmpA-OmpF porin, OOP family
VLFDVDKDSLKLSSVPLLRRVSALIKKSPDTDVRITVEGHADPQGSEQHNLALSQRRAERVARWLVQAGAVGSDRVNAVGYGESRPVVEASPGSPAQQKNRRVTLRIACPTGSP